MFFRLQFLFEETGGIQAGERRTRIISPQPFFSEHPPENFMHRVDSVRLLHLDFKCIMNHHYPVRKPKTLVTPGCEDNQTTILTQMLSGDISLKPKVVENE